MEGNLKNDTVSVLSIYYPSQQQTLLSMP